MPLYPDHYYAEFVARAQAAGSGLDKNWRRDGSLKALSALLEKDSTAIEVNAAISALARKPDSAHTNKLRKYRRAIAFLENTFPIAPGLRQAPVGMGVEAIRYARNPTPPTAQFPGGNIDFHSLVLSNSTTQTGLDMTVPDFMAANAATTRVLLVHLGQPQVDMGLNWDGITALAHMNAVLNTAAEHQIPVCVLCDPHERGRGIGLPTAGNAVCPGLRDAVGRLAGAHVWVADGGRKHSAFHDPAYQAWVSNPAVDTVVVLGFDADVCVRGNVFGIAEEAENVAPARVVPALINFVDVVTARPLLSGGERGIQAYKSWGSLCYMKQD